MTKRILRPYYNDQKLTLPARNKMTTNLSTMKMLAANRAQADGVISSANARLKLGSSPATLPNSGSRDPRPTQSMADFNWPLSLFFRVPPSFNMLKIQAGEQEKSEIYIYMYIFFFSFWVHCSVSEP